MRLVYLMDVTREGGAASLRVHVDTETGSTVYSESPGVHAFEPIEATASGLGGPRKMIVSRGGPVDEATGEATYTLYDPTHNVRTRATRQNGTVQSPECENYLYDEFKTSDLADWGLPNAAVDAHASAGAVLEFYKTAFGRDGVDGFGGRLEQIVGQCAVINEARTSLTGEMTVNYGPPRPGTFNVASFDAVAHEISHAVIVTTLRARTGYGEFKKATLHEALADIFSAFAQAAKPDGVERNHWLMGEDKTTSRKPIRMFGPHTRSDLDPAAPELSCPRTFKDYADGFHRRSAEQTACRASPNSPSCTGSVTSSDYAEQPYDSLCVLEAAVYLAVTGPQVAQVPAAKGTTLFTPLSLEEARAIFYKALKVYFTEDTSYWTIGPELMHAARDLFPAPPGRAGAKSDQVHALEVALGVTGLYPAPHPADYAASTGPTSDGGARSAP